MKWRMIAQGQPHAFTLWDAIAEEFSDDQFDHLDVAVAYVTLQGIKALELALGGMKRSSRWVVGIDDGVSQPKAIEHLMALKGTQVRLASMSPRQRFHPKLYCCWSSSNDDRCVTAVGSGNLTLNGLLHNGETAVILTAETRNEAANLREQWQSMWNLGEEATKDLINAYKENYKAASEQRHKLANLGITTREPKPSAPVDLGSRFDGNPTTARYAWLEAGSPSAGGRDLEFPRDIMPFFELRRSPTVKTFRMRDGQQFRLTFTERTDNQMWRLMFSRDAIYAAIGRETLRPVAGGNRSDLAIIFCKARSTRDYDVEMVAIGSRDHRRLMTRSRTVDGLFRTRNPGGRHFGLI